MNGDHEMGSYRKRPLGVTCERGDYSNSVDYGSNADSDDGFDSEEIRLNYRDFGTIDWFRELALDQKRHRKLKENTKDKSATFVTNIKGILDACSGWIIVTVVGLMAGCAAALIDISTKWLSDLKSGFCKTQFYMNKKQCCWSDINQGFDGDTCEEWVEYGDSKTILGQTGLFFMYCLMGTMLAGLAVIFVKCLAPYACGSGIPEVKTILSGFVMHGYLGFGTLIVKTMTMPLAVAAGLMLGKEGPLVHVACCCGRFVARFFPKYRHNEAKMREMLSAAAAAGVSVAFGAPIGGVLFSLEEVSYYFPLKTLWRSFFCALIAAFSLRALNPFGNEHLVLFYVTYDKPWFLFELVPFIFLGILGGLYGYFFIKANLTWCRFRKRSKLGQHPVAEVILLALGTSILAYPNPYTRMQTSHLIKLLFEECKSYSDNPLCDYIDNDGKEGFGQGIVTAAWQLILALLVKSALTVVTFGIKVPAGLFIPSMVTGAISGRLLGLFTQKVIAAFPDCEIWSNVCASHTSCIIPGLYAMVGAAAALGGVTRMTVSLVVIMFEVTGGMQYIVPFMVATMASKWIADALSKESIYDGHITLNEYPYLDVKEELSEQKTLITDVMSPKSGSIVTLNSQGQTVMEIEGIIKSNNYSGFPIVSESNRLVGFITRHDLEKGMSQAKKMYSDTIQDNSVVFTTQAPISASGLSPIRLHHLVDFSPITISEATNMALVVEIFRKLGCRQAFVLKRGDLVGVLTKKDLLHYITENRDRKEIKSFGCWNLLN